VIAGHVAEVTYVIADRKYRARRVLEKMQSQRHTPSDRLPLARFYFPKFPASPRIASQARDQGTKSFTHEPGGGWGGDISCLNPNGCYGYLCRSFCEAVSVHFS
jgi:hypothetical protein